MIRSFFLACGIYLSLFTAPTAFAAGDLKCMDGDFNQHEQEAIDNVSKMAPSPDGLGSKVSSILCNRTNLCSKNQSWSNRQAKIAFIYYASKIQLLQIENNISFSREKFEKFKDIFLKSDIDKFSNLFYTLIEEIINDKTPNLTLTTDMISFLEPAVAQSKLPMNYETGQSLGYWASTYGMKMASISMFVGSGEIK
ncbi:hypothetical protein [Sphingobium lactosutens]|uniref:hypothetical protein n=1 Tax=Sphingobium lactosutens TaxID=522773 RepID=UPI0015C0F2C7|nr:hypothetical protein [Sphingobium lactosutens]